MRHIHVVNGPNLNLLGKRQTDIYGTKTLEQINSELKESFAKDCKLSFFQSNSEGAIIDYVQSMNKDDLLVINAGAYSHTSIAIRDALLASGITFVEVHISNIYTREEFRHQSLLSDIASGVIVGFGDSGYHLAVYSLLRHPVV